jgi:outer membrane receptor protein involved in Fe transport
LLNLRLYLCAIAIVFSAGVRAEQISLGDLLERFRLAGYSLLYSTGVVDESIQVNWTGRLSISRLQDLLRDHHLALQGIGRRRWAVIKHDATPNPGQENDPVDVPAETIDNIVVTASRYDMLGSGASKYLIDNAQLNDMPSFAGDSLRVVHRLPGAATIGVSSKPNVRGGADDELLVVFDGVELVEPFHLRDFQSMFSSIHPRTIQHIQYFTGGFPAQYGNKLSGVLDIATQDVFAAPGGELGLSAYWSSALYFTEWDANQALISVRRGNLDLALDLVNPRIGEPRFHDIYARYARELDSGRIKASVFSFNDDIRLTGDEETAESRIENLYFWLDWEMQPSQSRYSRTLVSWGKVDRRRLGETFEEDRSEGSLRDDQRLRIANIKHLHEVKLGTQLRLDIGFSVKWLDMLYDTSVDVELGDVATFLGRPAHIDHRFIRDLNGNSISAFITGKYELSPRLTLQAGLRYDRQDYGFLDAQLSPRLSMLYQWSPRLRLQASYGQFHQPQEIHELRTTDLESTYQKVQRSDHWILAADYLLAEDHSLEVEVFFKDIRQLRPRYENLFDPYRFTPELEPDRVTISAESAFSSGFELSYSGSHGNADWNVNYSYSQARDKEHGRWIDRRWDQPHSVNAFINWHPGNWNIGVAAGWHTGWTMTRVPLMRSLDEPFVVADHRSNARLKNYLTVDAKVNHRFQLANSTLDVFLEVTNLVNRANKGGVDYEISLDEEQGSYLLEEVDLEPVFPLTPNVGILWRF